MEPYMHSKKKKHTRNNIYIYNMKRQKRKKNQKKKKKAFNLHFTRTDRVHFDGPMDGVIKALRQ